MTEPVYATPAAFKQALEQRLRRASSLERVDLARRRQLLVFDRFLASRVRAALQRTFEYRTTHPVPLSVPEAPAEWLPVYAMLAREDRLPWASLHEVLRAVRAFLDPVLADGASVTWSPQSWSWSTDALSP